MIDDVTTLVTYDYVHTVLPLYGDVRFSYKNLLNMTMIVIN